MKKIISLLLLVFLTSACSIYHITSQDTTVDYFPSKNSHKEVVYLEVVNRPHEIIGIVVSCDVMW